MSNQTDLPIDQSLIIDFDKGILLIVPLGDLSKFDTVKIEEASRDISESLERHPDAKVLLDMSYLNYCSSAWLGIVMGVWRLVSGRGGSFVMCHANQQIAKLLTVTKLNTLWSIHGSREAALLALTVPTEQRGA